MSDVKRYRWDDDFGDADVVLASDYDALRAANERLTRELVDLKERCAALESREVCTVAHDSVDTCGYCQRDEALVLLKEARENWLHEKQWIGGVENGEWKPVGAALLEFIRRIDAAIGATDEIARRTAAEQEQKQ